MSLYIIILWIGNEKIIYYNIPWVPLDWELFFGQELYIWTSYLNTCSQSWEKAPPTEFCQGLFSTPIVGSVNTDMSLDSICYFKCSHSNSRHMLAHSVALTFSHMYPNLSTPPITTAALKFIISLTDFCYSFHFHFHCLCAVPVQFTIHTVNQSMRHFWMKSWLLLKRLQSLT